MTEKELPPKPDVGPLPSDEELELEDPPGEEPVPVGEILSPIVAAADDTVDDQEDDEAGAP